MKREVIPPLSDCVQLSVEQYRQKLYDIIKEEKIIRYVIKGVYSVYFRGEGSRLKEDLNMTL